MYACAELFCVLTNVSNKFVFRRFPLRGGSTPSVHPCVRPCIFPCNSVNHVIIGGSRIFLGGGLKDELIRMCTDCIAVKTQLLR